MGVFVDYTLRAECTNEELKSRLEKVRQRCLDLPLRAVGQVQRITSVYNPVILDIFLKAGHALPEAIAERLGAIENEREHGDRCLSFMHLPEKDIPDDFQARYFAPAVKLIEETTLWKKENLPAEVGDKTPWGWSTLTVSQYGLELEFANVLLRYGYYLLLDPGEGCETVTLALSTYGTSEANPASPLWYGQGFTKTQYAKDFIPAHETVCRVIDIAAEEGLLFSGSDSCGYYESRNWEEASKGVNEELMFARAVSGIIGVEIGNLREEGVQITEVVNNAGKAKPVDFSSVLKPRPNKSEGGETG